MALYVTLSPVQRFVSQHKIFTEIIPQKCKYIGQHNTYVVSFAKAHISHGKYAKLFIFMAAHDIIRKQTFCFINTYQQHISYRSRIQQRLVPRWPAKPLTSDHQTCRYASAFAKDRDRERDSQSFLEGPTGTEEKFEKGIIGIQCQRTAGGRASSRSGICVVLEAIARRRA